MHVLLSINPIHVDNIFAGVKTFEYRRRVFARKDIKTVVVYCTRPVAKLVGEFDIADIICDKPDRLWQRTKQGSGISESFFDDYFYGREQGFALQIGAVRAFSEKIDPKRIFQNFFPPQSYMYLPEFNQH